ncbi:probable ubiquitin carboxyl-terminal hydrolase MINDY-4 [Cololabis saira]|uniref:probable ubiquitin carboxyl-terminal hydrolase MINDY-4 n=1 Tax=Cololabis saira TaxID=129043 RepID=UPI002AD5240A|nr:probable ubiquitin carboxyl-terminal hydrolase MINDY-4 [Cololabis saira]
MIASAEEVSSSLVREYLSRKGLGRTLACMDEEHPRTEFSINNRSNLRQMLNIEDLYRKNKAQSFPLKTLLEIIVKHHIEQLDSHKTVGEDSKPLICVQTVRSTAVSAAETPSIMDDTQANQINPPLFTIKHSQKGSDQERLSRNIQTDVLAHDSEYRKSQPWMPSLQDNENIIQKHSDKNAFINEATQKSRTNRVRRGMMVGPTPQDSNRRRQSQRVEASQTLFRREEENKCSLDGHLVTGINQKSLESTAAGISSAKELLNASGRIQSETSYGITRQSPLNTKKLKTRANVSDLDASDMVLDDIDDDDLQEFSKVSIQRTVAECHYARRPMDQHTAMELKTVLLGSSLNCFSAEWRNQGFTFSDADDLRYGIVQRKGGPCGVLASIQVIVLKKLLFENPEFTENSLQLLRPSNTARRKCLVSALAEVLWKAGEERQATIAINSGTNHFIASGQYRSEGVLEKIICLIVDNFKDLQLILEQHIEQFETGTLGCILLTISAVLTRSIEKVREDMDMPTSTLIGAHGYCTQELVNLLICGKAISNVFDGDLELNSGSSNTTLLKGIKSHCDVGFLSLFEHYNVCKVGAYLKTPTYPIWVVCSESHFSVLFSLQRELLTNEDKSLEFDLYYYDGLANQQEEIRLTVSVGKSTQSLQEIDNDLIPPLDLCIRTRWKDAVVDWNDTEPLL